MARGKYYVVFEGLQPGIYDSWEECKAQTEGVSGARYKSYPTLEDATEAFRGEMDKEEMKFYTFLTKKSNQMVNYQAFPEIRLDAWAVDAACDSPASGKVEYQCVEVGTGKQIFKVGPLEGGSNNIGEYLAVVHALALLAQQGNGDKPIYTDSQTAISWVRHGHNYSTLQIDPNSRLGQVLARADRWIGTHRSTNPLLKWDTKKWGEIPADFGRK